jgi:hypothetical protein
MAILKNAADSDGVVLRAVEPARVLLIAGLPLNEPIAQHGPFVMNTRDELIAAVQDYQAGNFPRRPKAPDRQFQCRCRIALRQAARGDPRRGRLVAEVGVQPTFANHRPRGILLLVVNSLEWSCPRVHPHPRPCSAGLR